MRIQKWSKRKQMGSKQYKPNEVLDGKENEYLDDVLLQSIKADPCLSTNELRIFVGTWNVAGRSPVGSLAVDLDECLNLKDTAEMYVLGFQEVVPLKARTVIGAEDLTEAANWNLLIGKTLNDKYGCPWLTSMFNPTSGGKSQDGSTPTTEGKTQDLKRKSSSKYELVARKKMV